MLKISTTAITALIAAGVAVLTFKLNEERQHFEMSKEAMSYLVRHSESTSNTDNIKNFARGIAITMPPEFAAKVIFAIQCTRAQGDAELREWLIDFRVNHLPKLRGLGKVNDPEPWSLQWLQVSVGQFIRDLCPFCRSEDHLFLQRDCDPESNQEVLLSLTTPPPQPPEPRPPSPPPEPAPAELPRASVLPPDKSQPSVSQNAERCGDLRRAAERRLGGGFSVFPHVSQSSDRPVASQILANLQDPLLRVQSTEVVPNWPGREAQIRFYRADDKPVAEYIQCLLLKGGSPTGNQQESPLLRNLRAEDISRTYPNLPSNRLEIWFAKLGQ